MAVRVANQPPPLRDYNLVAENRPLVEAVRREGAGWAEEGLLAFGDELGGEPLEWGRLANEHPPVLRTHDRFCEPVGGGKAELQGPRGFCPGPMGGAFLVPAQAPAGLTCYFVPRSSSIVIERLKDKLGNRSNASAEIRLEGAWGRQIGEEGRGVA